MYNFIFYFFYSYHKKGRSYGPRETAGLAVALTIFLHFFMLWTGVKFFTGINIFPIKKFSDDYFTNKLFFMPFMMAFGFLVVKYYNHKRAMQIINKYPKDYKVVTLRNVLLVILIAIVPLLISIQFVNNTK